MTDSKSRVLQIYPAASVSTWNNRYWICRSMKRTTIFLTPEQIKRLDKVAASKGLKPAQLIRVYINAGLAKEKA